MVDPLRQFASPVPSANHARHEQEQRWIAAYRENILLPDVTLADRKAPPFISGIVDETGEELTYERRMELAQQRTLKDPGDYRTMEFADQAVKPPEGIGASTQRLMPKAIRVVQPVKAEEDVVEEARQEMADVEDIIAIEKALNNAN